MEQDSNASEQKAVLPQPGIDGASLEKIKHHRSTFGPAPDEAVSLLPSGDLGETQRLTLIEEATVAWNRGDLDGYLSLYDEDVEVHGYAPVPMNKADMREYGRTIFDTLSPEGRGSPVLEVFDTICDGAWVANHFAISGVHRGPLMGVPATGRPFRINGVSMFRFGSNNKVVERRVAIDLYGLMVQIGAVPPPI